MSAPNAPLAPNSANPASSARASASAKVCVACRKDVTRLPRHKDEKGRYLCNECMAAAKARSAERHEPAPPAPESEEAAAFAALMPDSPAAEPAFVSALPCPSCGVAMAPGSVVCVRCGFDSRAGVKSMMKSGKAAKSSSSGADAARVAGKLAVGAAKLAAGPAALVMCAVLAVIGGLIGAGIWAGVVYATHYQVGYVAVLVGGIVGVGARMGAGRYVGLLSGLIAAAVAVGAVGGGRYFALSMEVDEIAGKIGTAIADFTEEEIRVKLADGVVEEFTAAGKPLKWPEGMSVEEAYEEEHYPPEVWKEAAKRWDAMTEDQKYEFETAMVTDAQARLRAVTSTIKEEGFFDSFEPLDFVFFGLALVVAFGAGAGGGGDD